MKEEIKKNIIEKIKAGQIKQIPKWHFVLKSVLAVLLLIAVATTTLYLMAFMGLIFKEHELFRLFHISPHGIFVFMHTVPWFLMTVTIFLIGILHILIRKYSFAFTRPLFLTIVGVVVGSVLIAAGVFVFDKNSRFARLGEGREIPFLSILEKEYRQDFFGDVTHGKVVSIDQDSFAVQTPHKGVLYTVLLKTDDVKKDDLVTGDFVMILGERKGDTIFAEKIEKAHFQGFPDRRGEQRH